MAANMAERRNTSGHQFVIVPNIANLFDQWTANLLVGVLLDLFGLSLLFYADMYPAVGPVLILNRMKF